MSRLHTCMAGVDEVARHFDAEAPDGLTIPADTFEGCPGLVVIERDGRRHLRTMTWSFPRHTREARDRGDPPGHLGLVADLTNPMWDRLVPESRYRCLIVLTHFANPDGPSGGKTRTWFSVKDQPLAAWAGFCRNTPEFGPVYAGMTREANAAIPPTNDRMPAILEPHEWTTWLGGSIKDVIRFQFQPPIAPDRIVIERTDERWNSHGLPTWSSPQMALL